MHHLCLGLFLLMRMNKTFTCSTPTKDLDTVHVLPCSIFLCRKKNTFYPIEIGPGLHRHAHEMKYNLSFDLLSWVTNRPLVPFVLCMTWNMNGITTYFHVFIHFGHLYMHSWMCSVHPERSFKMFLRKLLFTH